MDNARTARRTSVRRAVLALEDQDDVERLVNGNAVEASMPEAVDITKPDLGRRAMFRRRVASPFPSA